MADPGRYTLYAMRCSLYSSKARSYMLARGIDFVELPPGDSAYAAEVTPTIGRWIIPVLKTPEGRLIQDTEDIIEHLDADAPEGQSAYPDGGVVAVLARVLSMCGSEGLMRPAMHFRWNFDEHNMPFVLEDFGRGLAVAGTDAFRDTSLQTDGGGAQDPAEARAAIAKFAGDRMRQLTKDFGVDERTAPTVESSYLDFLERLSAHFELYPYLLGGRPTLADHAFMAPLYAHLSRDPYPADLMKRHAWPVWSWVERMMNPTSGTGQYGPVSAELFADDAVPDTLRSVLAWFGDEMAAEITAQVHGIDRLLDEDPEIGEGSVVGGKPSRRSVGKVPYTWRGHDIESWAIPYRITHLQRIQAELERVDAGAQAAARDLLEATGLGPLLTLRARRTVVRQDNREVWGPEQQPVLA